MPKYEDCESCAFYKVEPAICDECEDADQWEPEDELAMARQQKQRREVSVVLLKKAA